MLKRIIISVVTASLMIALTGCWNSAADKSKEMTDKSAAATDAPKSVNSNEVYVEVTALTGHPYFAEHKRGMEEAGKALGVKTEFIGPVDFDIPGMITTLEQTIAKKPAGILVVGLGDELAPSINKAIEAGIPVVTVDGDVASSKRLSFVGTGNYSVGVIGGKALAQAMNEKGKVLIMTKIGQANLEERTSGYKDTIAKYPDMKIVQVAESGSDNGVTASAVAAILQANPDLGGIVTTDATGPGVVSALKEAGKKAGDVKVIVMDRIDDHLQLIKDGWVLGAVAQRTALMTFMGTEILYNLVHKNIQITGDDAKAKVNAVPDKVDTGTIFIDKNNVELFMSPTK
jgi:ribose transport system substrate-binding protein